MLCWGISKNMESHPEYRLAGGLLTSFIQSQCLCYNALPFSRALHRVFEYLYNCAVILFLFFILYCRDSCIVQWSSFVYVAIYHSRVGFDYKHFQRTQKQDNQVVKYWLYQIFIGVCVCVISLTCQMPLVSLNPFLCRCVNSVLLLQIIGLLTSTINNELSDWFKPNKVIFENC